jgi:hypothetical protein
MNEQEENDLAGQKANGIGVKTTLLSGRRVR